MFLAFAGSCTCVLFVCLFAGGRSRRWESGVFDTFVCVCVIVIVKTKWRRE